MEIAFRWPHTREELSGLAAIAAQNHHRVIVLGGDGTLLDAVNAIAGTQSELGLIPAGDANDVAAALGLPQDPFLAAEIAVHGGARPIDLVRARLDAGCHRLFVGVGGAGLDAQAARLAATRFRRLPGIWRYVAGALVALARTSPFALSAEFDGQILQCGAILAVAANAPAYGGGIRIAPHARMDDGWLDAVVLENLNWRQVLRILPSLLRSGDTSKLKLRHYRARHIHLDCWPLVDFHGDGEFLGRTPAELEVLPGALRIVCPPDSTCPASSD